MRSGGDEQPDTRASDKYWLTTWRDTATGEIMQGDLLEVKPSLERFEFLAPRDTGNLYFDVSTMKVVMANANVGDDFTISIYPRAIDCESGDPCSNPLKIVYIVDEPAADISSADSDSSIPGFSVITLLVAVGAAASMISRRRNQYEEI
jgi:hypothetical protein